jgi:ankyrin repeat protein
MITMPSDDPVAVRLIQAIRGGDVDGLIALLDESPGSAAARLEGRRGSRTALHVATDWPGYFPNAPAVVRLLLDAGAEPNAPATGGAHAETPLHWTASSDDVDVAEALIDGGADLEAPGGSIAETPLDNAVGYGCWHLARLLVARGARVQRLWQAAALGLMSRVEELLAATPRPSAEEIDDAFWQACHGGQRRAAEHLLARGADLNRSPGYASQTPLDIAGALETRRDNVVTWLRDLGATAGGT